MIAMLYSLSVASSERPTYVTFSYLACLVRNAKLHVENGEVLWIFASDTAGLSFRIKTG